MYRSNLLGMREKILFGIAIFALAGILLASISAETAFSIPSDKGPPELEKIVFIHYYKPSHISGGPNCGVACQGNEDDKTFRLINGGIKWANLPIDYLISNQFSNSEATAIKDSADTWDDALDVRSLNPINLFGNNPSNTRLTQVNAGVNDGENIIVRGDLASNIIGVTSFWYNPATK